MNFCLINSWVGVVTLVIFWWISSTQPALLEIYTEDKTELENSRAALLTSSLIYFVIAVILTIVIGFLAVKERRERGQKLLPIEEENETLTLKAFGRKSDLTESEFGGSNSNEDDNDDLVG